MSKITDKEELREEYEKENAMFARDYVCLPGGNYDYFSDKYVHYLENRLFNLLKRED